ncbi:MAG: hypothetical protein ABIP71_12915 [Verrucomicrobiota bacterium]
MRNVNPKKTRTSNATPKEHKRGETIPAVATEPEIPPFMVRLARERRVKISKDLTIPKHRHD